MSHPPAPQVCPPHSVFDRLELARAEVLPATSVAVPLTAAEAGDATESGDALVVDPEGVPIARLSPVETGRGTPTATVQEWLGTVSPRPFERLYRSPGEVRESAAPATVLIDRPLTAEDRTCLRGLERPLLLVLAGPTIAPPPAVLRTLRVTEALSVEIAGATAVAVPLSPGDASDDPALRAAVLEAYAPGVEVHRLPEVDEAPEYPAGSVVLFTGLSGSGKSTVARAVRDHIVENHDQPVSLLDGDVVRRNLSAGLTFCPADRDTNIRRIGWVAAEIAHHGGLAICSPIAPHDATREAVRVMTHDRGGQFVLVHVSTPVEECERRDRKGLYAKARAGEIQDFTGVNAPYEAPEHPDLALDTTTISVAAARDLVLDLLRRRGVLPERGAPWTR